MPQTLRELSPPARSGVAGGASLMEDRPRRTDPRWLVGEVGGFSDIRT